MKVLETALPGVKLIEPRVFGDARGYFFESWSHQRFASQVAPASFVQDNVSRSERGVLRGLHLQHPHGQGKLIWVAVGSVYDVALDVRTGSPAFGEWVGYELSDTNHRQLYIPPGFAHGFCVLSDVALFCYKCTEYYDAESEMGILYCDPDLNIDWPLQAPKLSDKDRRLPRLADIPPERLPSYG